MLAGWKGAMRGAGVVLLGTAAASAVAPARAQMNLPPSIGNFTGITGAPNVGGHAPPEAVGRATRPPPAGLPGAQSTGTAAPANRPLPMMDPTQELFDAINRGDIAAARDAVSRGADLNGKNILEMTPVQLSIDLGRNDITFMLLANGAGQSRPASAPPAQGGAGLLAAASSGSKATHRAAREQRSKPVHLVVTAPATPQVPRLFAGNGGTPIPGAGFLGFDNR